jgi:dCMP deaminase
MRDSEYLRDALIYAAVLSDDPNTKVGAVLVTGSRRVYGCNLIPNKIDYVGLLRDGETKHTFTEHAERVAIYRAAAAGVPTAGAKLYAPWFACPDCARAIILAGISEVIGLASLDAQTPDRWRRQIDVALTMLRQAGVATRWLSDRVGAEILFDGRRVAC